MHMLTLWPDYSGIRSLDGMGIIHSGVGWNFSRILEDTQGGWASLPGQCLTGEVRYLVELTPNIGNRNGDYLRRPSHGCLTPVCGYMYDRWRKLDAY